MAQNIERKYSPSLRLQQWMSENDATQTDILDRCKRFSEMYNADISRSLLSYYVSGKSEIGRKRLLVLSKALNVSPVWLMGYDVPQSPEPQTDEEVDELKNALYLLNEEGRKKLMDYAADLMGNKKYRRK